MSKKEKWILTAKELHLGHCKDTFRAGAILEYDVENDRLWVDGRKFDDSRDLDILKRQSAKFPDNPWIVPFSAENKQAVAESVIAPVVVVKRTGAQMQVIKSDQDLSEDIDIRDTQVSKANNAAKQESRDKVKTEGMEVIRGDESVEERIANLKGKNDINSIAERARLKASGSVKMAIVKDDSLGAGFTGKSSMSMNAGQHLPSRKEADAKTEVAKAKADARKSQITAERKRGGVVEGDDEVDSEVTVEKVSERETSLQAQNDELKQRLDSMEKLMIANAAATPKRAPKKAKAV
jgi:hypothetical protein